VDDYHATLTQRRQRFYIEPFILSCIQPVVELSLSLRAISPPISIFLQNLEFHFHLYMSNDTVLPFISEGITLIIIKVPGYPTGANDFCVHLIHSVNGKVENDLDHIRQLNWRWQRLVISSAQPTHHIGPTAHHLTSLCYPLRVGHRNISLVQSRAYDRMIENLKVRAHILAFWTITQLSTL
jgi:hypothetical protein